MTSPGDSTVLFRRVSKQLKRKWIRDFGARLRSEVGGGRETSFLITSDRELQRLNLTFRGKDYPTDVLSFPTSGPDGSLGDVAISAERSAEQARTYGHSVEEEIGILMLHGVLHLLGMDHENDRGRMARAEKRWRKALGLPVGLIERVRA
jgi:probable rRNA maturation factor